MPEENAQSSFLVSEVKVKFTADLTEMFAALEKAGIKDGVLTVKVKPDLAAFSEEMEKIEERVDKLNEKLAAMKVPGAYLEPARPMEIPKPEPLTAQQAKEGISVAELAARVGAMQPTMRDVLGPTNALEVQSAEQIDLLRQILAALLEGTE